MDTYTKFGITGPNKTVDGVLALKGKYINEDGEMDLYDVQVHEKDDGLREVIMTSKNRDMMYYVAAYLWRVSDTKVQLKFTGVDAVSKPPGVEDAGWDYDNDSRTWIMSRHAPDPAGGPTEHLAPLVLKPPPFDAKKTRSNMVAIYGLITGRNEHRVHGAPVSLGVVSLQKEEHYVVSPLTGFSVRALVVYDEAALKTTMMGWLVNEFYAYWMFSGPHDTFTKPPPLWLVYVYSSGEKGVWQRKEYRMGKQAARLGRVYRSLRKPTLKQMFINAMSNATLSTLPQMTGAQKGSTITVGEWVSMLQKNIAGKQHNEWTARAHSNEYQKQVYAAQMEFGMVRGDEDKKEAYDVVGMIPTTAYLDNDVMFDIRTADDKDQDIELDIYSGYVGL